MFLKVIVFEMNVVFFFGLIKYNQLFVSMVLGLKMINMKEKLFYIFFVFLFVVWEMRIGELVYMFF